MTQFSVISSESRGVEARTAPPPGVGGGHVPRPLKQRVVRHVPPAPGDAPVQQASLHLFSIIDERTLSPQTGESTKLCFMCSIQFNM